MSRTGTEPIGADVRFPAHRVPNLADEFYSPTLGDYLSFGDERQQAIAREQLRRLIDAHPGKTEQQLVDGPIFPSGDLPTGELP